MKNLTIGLLVLLAYLAFAPLSWALTPDANTALTNEHPTTDKEKRVKVDYLGKQFQIDRHSKPLPNRQYDIEEYYPNFDAAVIYMAPETPPLKITPKQPLEGERLRKWLQEWDRIKNNQELVNEYRGSYMKFRDVDYLIKAAQLQKTSISDLFELQKISWPNSDYAYKAYRKKVSSCQKLNSLVELGSYEGIILEKANVAVCSHFP